MIIFILLFLIGVRYWTLGVAKNKTTIYTDDNLKGHYWPLVRKMSWRVLIISLAGAFITRSCNIVEGIVWGLLFWFPILGIQVLLMASIIIRKQKTEVCKRSQQLLATKLMPQPPQLNETHLVGGGTSAESLVDPAQPPERSNLSCGTVLSSTHLWLNIEKQNIGPYSKTEIEDRIRTGVISEETLCWGEGFETWMPISDYFKIAVNDPGSTRVEHQNTAGESSPLLIHRKETSSSSSKHTKLVLIAVFVVIGTLLLGVMYFSIPNKGNDGSSALTGSFAEKTNSKEPTDKQTKDSESTTTLSPKEIFQKYSNRVVEVQAINSKGEVAATGSGFCWKGKAILTNFHVVEQARDIKIKQNTSINKVMYVQASMDQDWIQLFNLTGSDNNLYSPVPIAESLPDVGENVIVIGNPEGLTNSLSTGVVSGLRNDGNNVWIQITAPISHGSSGSPVFDSKGRLLGLATLMVVDGQNLNFATPIGQITKFISESEAKAKVTGDAMAFLNNYRDYRPENFKELPFKDLGRNKEFILKGDDLSSKPHTEVEIQKFAQKYLEDYSDPIDQIQVYYAVARAYEARDEHQKAMAVLKKKMSLFGETWTDWQDLGDYQAELNNMMQSRIAYQKALRVALEEFEIEMKPNADPNSKPYHDPYMLIGIGISLDHLQGRSSEAIDWFDAGYLVWNSSSSNGKRVIPFGCPTWYQTLRKEHPVDNSSLLENTGFDAKAYYNNRKTAWISDNDNQIFSFLRIRGMKLQTQEKMASIGIDTYSMVWWESNILSKLNAADRLILQTYLEQRKSIREN